MELVVDRKNGNKVFTLEDGKLKEQVWEPTPVTRFRFKKPVENEWVRERLAANYPTCGIVFNGIPYVGTSDGFVCTPGKKVQRIPEILVDEDLFIDEYPFKKGERELYDLYKKEGLKALSKKEKNLVSRILEIDELREHVDSQNRSLDRYLAPPEHGLARISILGFVVHKEHQSGEEKLYDGHLLGITRTEMGELVHNLIPHALLQINATTAGFVPSGYPPQELERIAIEDGFEKRIPVHCVDYRSLWSLSGQVVFVKDICPRDGSGYAPAKFATDGEVIAISHGNHPCYTLDILMQKNGKKKEVKSLELDPQKLPQKLFIKNSEVYGYSGNAVVNFSRGEKVEVIFQPVTGKITSFSDSGNCTVDMRDGERTQFYNVFTGQPFADLKGEYEYLPATRQS